jgi:hypothetical protein
VCKLNDAQSELLTAVDPALEAKLAVSASPSKQAAGGEAALSKQTLEHLPSAIAQAMANDESVTQGLEDMLATITTMALLGKESMERKTREEEAEQQEARTELAAARAALEALRKEQGEQHKSAASTSEALLAEQAAHAAAAQVYPSLLALLVQKYANAHACCRRAGAGGRQGGAGGGGGEARGAREGARAGSGGH